MARSKRSLSSGPRRQCVRHGAGRPVALGPGARYVRSFGRACTFELPCHSADEKRSFFLGAPAQGRVILARVRTGADSALASALPARGTNSSPTADW